MTRAAAFITLMTALAAAAWGLSGIHFIAVLCLGAALFFTGWAFVPEEDDDDR